MNLSNESTVLRLVTAVLGERALAALDLLDIDAGLLAETGNRVSRASFAMALAVVLFDDLLARVPSGARYVETRRRVGARIKFDHGALRTIRFANGQTGALPSGQDAFARILEPLGYVVAETYPLPALKMTGYAYRHCDLPEAVPQYFVSELHVERFDAAFGAAAHRVFDASRDPLAAADAALLDVFARDGAAPVADALVGLQHLGAAFSRRHPTPAFADYRTLLEQSSEAAWIATEGNAFNHATDRVNDVEALHASLRAEGWAIKPTVEISESTRVRQTALRADLVERAFAGGEVLPVPGSFYEFITRHAQEHGKLDLAFDSANATGIFAMTRAA
jgi:hypothetical protein